MGGPAEAIEGDHHPALRFGRDELQRLLSIALEKGGEYADVYGEENTYRSFLLEEGGVKEIHYRMESGMGIRVVKGEATGFAFTEDLSARKREEAARTASRIADDTGMPAVVSIPPNPRPYPNYTPVLVPLELIGEENRIEVMKKAEQAARGKDNRIKEVSVHYQESRRRMVVANSRGIWGKDERPLIYFTVHALAEDGGTRHQGRRRVSATSGFELFQQIDPASVGSDAAGEAVTMLSAVDAPAGEKTVVMASGWGGVLFHEAIGHGLEGDAVRTGASYFSGKLEKQVASPLVTLVDDPTIPNLRGSYSMDDEGTPSRRKVLIEKGILKEYMTDLLSARLLGLEPNGSARRQSFRYYPLVRMSNTFVLPGNDDPGEIIRNTRSGLYAKSFTGGMVDTVSGDFTFTVREAYLIENGEITHPVRGATLIGNGTDVLNRIDRIAYDLQFAPGTCGKGQWVPVTSGEPTLRISAITVGGSSI
jgi:TldD protein